MFLLCGFILPQTYLYFSILPIICLLDTNYFLNSHLTLWIKLCSYIIHTRGRRGGVGVGRGRGSCRACSGGAGGSGSPWRTSLDQRGGIRQKDHLAVASGSEEGRGGDRGWQAGEGGGEAKPGADRRGSGGPIPDTKCADVLTSVL